MHPQDPTVPPPPPGAPPPPPTGPPGAPGGGYPPAAAAMQGPPGGHIPKPGKLQAIAIMMLISGIINCLYGVLLIFGCWTAILTPLLLTAGILEIIHATKILKDPIEVYKPATGIAVLEICSILGCNVYSMVAGIINLIFWGDPQVKQYYRDVAIARGFQPQV
ncbi:hypothetical protein OT109_04515 [Phycisphaeraceae bacterium D3-23]